MKKKSVLLVSLMLVTAAVLVAFFVPITVGGQESPAQPGTPAYTEALQSKALPPPPPKFGGEIKPTAPSGTARDVTVDRMQSQGGKTWG